MFKTKVLFAILALFAVFSTVAEAKLYKWVDDKGETHYGEVVPPEYADRERKQLEQGMEVKKKPEKPAAGPAKPVEKTPEQVEQERRDQALLGTFSSEDEIDLARDRNLQQVNAHMAGVEMRIKSAQDDLDGYSKEKAALEKAKKPVDKVLQEQFDAATAKLAKLQDERAKVEAEGAAIRARYDADKKRYHELKNPNNK